MSTNDEAKEGVLKLMDEYETQILEKTIELAERTYTLRDYGYAPGDYLCKCHYCEKEHQADKRSACCEECAEKRLNEWNKLSRSERIGNVVLARLLQKGKLSAKPDLS